MIMIFIIRHVSEGFRIPTTDIITTIPGSAICITIPTTHSTGAPVSTSVAHGEDSDATIIITHPITATIFITIIIPPIPMGGVGTVLTTMVPIIQDITTVITMATGVVETIITTTTEEAVTMATIQAVPECTQTVQPEVTPVLPQEKVQMQTIHATDQPELPTMVPARRTVAKADRIQVLPDHQPVRPMKELAELQHREQLVLQAVLLNQQDPKQVQVARVQVEPIHVLRAVITLRAIPSQELQQIPDITVVQDPIAEAPIKAQVTKTQVQADPILTPDLLKTRDPQGPILLTAAHPLVQAQVTADRPLEVQVIADLLREAQVTADHRTAAVVQATVVLRAAQAPTVDLPEVVQVTAVAQADHLLQEVAAQVLQGHLHREAAALVELQDHLHREEAGNY
jgi:hypothetical protein